MFWHLFIIRIKSGLIGAICWTTWIRFGKCTSSKPLMITKTFREYGKIDHQRFHNFLSANTESFPDCDDHDVLVQSFNAITSSVLNEVCPLITKTTAVKHRLPWYNDVIHDARRERRRLERRWKRSRSEVDEERFRLQKELVGKLITESKIRFFFTDKCIPSNSKEMYRTINSLLNKPSKFLPDSDSKHDLANKFLTFFIEKVENICTDVSSKDTSALIIMIRFLNAPCPIFNHLKVRTFADIIRQFPSKSCSLDTIPSWLVKRNLGIFLPQSLRLLMLLFLPALSLLLLKSPSLHLWLRWVTLTETRLRTIGMWSTYHFFQKSLRRQRHVKLWTLLTLITLVSPFSLRISVTTVQKLPSLKLKMISSAPLIITKLSSWSFLTCLLASTLSIMTSC